MSVTIEEVTPKPVDAPLAAAEAKAEQAAPAAVKPEVKLIEDEFNAVVTDAQVAAPAEKAADAAKEPGLAAVADDAEKVASGGAVQVGTLTTDLIAASREVKAGYKTTEFWLTLVGLALTNLSIIKIPGKYGQAITDSAALAAYVLSRGIAKHGI